MADLLSVNKAIQKIQYFLLRKLSAKQTKPSENILLERGLNKNILRTN